MTTSVLNAGKSNVWKKKQVFVQTLVKNVFVCEIIKGTSP